MSGQRAHQHVPEGQFTPHRPIPTLPANVNGFLDTILASPTHLANDILLASPPLQPAMSTAEEQIQQLRQLAEAQQNQIAEQQKQMDEANQFANLQTEQLRESKRQLEASQQSVIDLTNAFRDLTAHPRPLTVSTTPKKKPELPPFDSKNILVWIRRVEAAYARSGTTEAKDKFAWMEGIFQVKLDPQIDAYLYGTNTSQDWSDFISYLKLRYGPTIREKAQKLLTDIPRHDLTPSQYLIQLNEDTKDVTVDHIKREHLLKTIPPRIREMLGKEVESMSAEEVAKAADSFFDRTGKPLERHSAPINQVATQPSFRSTSHLSSSSSSSSSSAALPSTSATPPPSFTTAYSDEDETDINFVRRNQRGNNRGRSQSRNQRSNSRPPFNRPSNAPSTGSSQTSSQPSHPQGTCRWHRLFGDKSRKCVTDCPRFKSFQASLKSGNGQGGHRQ